MKIETLYRFWNLSRKKVRQYVSDKDTAYSFYENGTFYVVINPTDKLREWVENLMFWTTTEFGTAYGYANASEELFEQIKRDYKGGNVELIGASRGGAIGFDMYFRFNKEFRFINQITLTTFGCPPVGNSESIAYAKKIGMIHTRVVNKNDCVPHHPKWRKHYESTLIFLDNDYRKTVKFWKRCKTAHLGYGKQLSDILIEKRS